MLQVQAGESEAVGGDWHPLPRPVQGPGGNIEANIRALQRTYFRELSPTWQASLKISTVPLDPK